MYALGIKQRNMIAGDVKSVKTRKLCVSVHTCRVVVLYYEAQYLLFEESRSRTRLQLIVPDCLGQHLRTSPACVAFYRPLQLVSRLTG
jgi:hypothetical protein